MSAAGRFLPYRAAAWDPRLSWCGYVPAGHVRATAVLVHGSDRDPVALITAFRGWASTNGIALLAPLFPGKIDSDDDMDAYKTLTGAAVRYDSALVAMVDEFAAEHDAGAAPFLLFGFSGGAQFAHRFALVRPGMLLALGIASPGNVTLIGSDHVWWPGVRDAAVVFGSGLDLAALRRVPVHALVGADDDGREVIAVQPFEPRWVEGANDAGVTRGERLASLVNDWREQGIRVEHTTVAGARHELEPFVDPTTNFFDGVLAARQTGGGDS